MTELNGSSTQGESSNADSQKNLTILKIEEVLGRMALSAIDREDLVALDRALDQLMVVPFAQATSSYSAIAHYAATKGFSKIVMRIVTRASDSERLEECLNSSFLGATSASQSLVLQDLLSFVEKTLPEHTRLWNTPQLSYDRWYTIVLIGALRDKRENVLDWFRWAMHGKPVPLKTLNIALIAAAEEGNALHVEYLIGKGAECYDGAACAAAKKGNTRFLQVLPQDKVCWREVVMCACESQSVDTFDYALAQYKHSSDLDGRNSVREEWLYDVLSMAFWKTVVLGNSTLALHLKKKYGIAIIFDNRTKRYA